MNPNPPSNPGYPGANPQDPNEATQLRPTWQSGENPQYALQPPYGQVPPAQVGGVPPQGPQGPGFQGPGLAPAPKSPRPSWLLPTILGGGAVLLVIVLIAGVAIVRSLGGGSSEGPGATVKAYFAALQAGDAKKALSYGKEAPASTELLTDELLKKQTQIAPIKDLKIVSETDSYLGQVHLTVTIGDVAYDEELSMEKSGDQWKLKTAAVQIKPSISSEADKKYLTVLGKPLPASGVAYVFPGALDLGSSNSNLTPQQSKYSVGDDKGQASVKGLSAFSVGSYARIQFGLSDAGKSAAREQITAKYAACAASKQRYLQGCPQSDASGEDGTYVWTAPSADGIDLSDDVSDGAITFRDTRPWNYTATTRDGRPVTGSDTVYISGTITVTQDAVGVSVR